ncbi:YNH2 [Hepatospora eriocheir]|uniref:Ribonuclease n=1 Tax=Hepatospora eriocheir TaxID=1081669 RepID=A0A1X0QFD5_9MICR|nr:YNH2 [Hepatospora eriocheir]
MFENQFISTIEDEITKEVVVGIDEAGRGPAIGPMVYAACIYDPDDKTKYYDSKACTPVQRTKLAEKCLKNNFAVYKSISPVYITSNMERNVKNLNEISREAVVEILQEVKKKCKNVKMVYIDGLGDNVKYKTYLKKFFDYNFTIENKADSLYNCVSAASILAKVKRDEFFVGKNIGSGYPSDPNTKNWLRKNKDAILGFPNFVRHSWSTIKNLLPQRKSTSLKGKLKGFYFE